MKAYVIDQSRNESIVMSHHLLLPVNHQSLTGRPIFSFTLTDCYWPIKIQKKRRQTLRVEDVTDRPPSY